MRSRLQTETTIQGSGAAGWREKQRAKKMLSSFPLLFNETLGSLLFLKKAKKLQSPFKSYSYAAPSPHSVSKVCFLTLGTFTGRGGGSWGGRLSAKTNGGKMVKEPS